MNARSMLLALCAVSLGAAKSAAQAPAGAADSALAACLAGGVTGSALPRAARESITDQAERLWRAELAAGVAPASSRVGLARVLVQCRLALATGPSEMMGLFQAGVELLEAALAQEPNYWPARFTLGLVYAGAPDFLGYGGAAIEQLELALAPGGIPAGAPERAEALQELARLYQRQGRSADAATARARVAAPSAPAPAPPAPAPAPASVPPPPAPRPDSTLTMAGVTVTTTSPASPLRGNQEGHAVTALDIVTMPGGAGDLMQVLQVLPGVTGGSESSDLSLRGGDPYEAPVLLNGGRLAYAGTFESLSGSLFGVLDPEVLHSVRVHTAGFSVRFGDALSGIIDAEALGRPAARSRRFALHTAGAAATVMAPLGGAGGVWASTRLTNTSVMLRMHGRSDDYASDPVAVQGIAGYTRRVRAGEWRAVALVEHDDASPWLTIAGHHGAWSGRGTSAAAVLSARMAGPGPLTTLRLNGTVSSRASATSFGVLDISRQLARGSVRAEGDVVLGGALLTAGLEVARLGERFVGVAPSTPSFAPGSPVSAADTWRRGDHAGAFAEALIAPAAWLTVTPGLRADRLPGEKRVTVDPRLTAEAVFGLWVVTLAGGVFHQGSFRPTREAPGLDERIGVARRARHLVLGAERRGAVTVRGDVYLKRYDEWTGADPALTPASGTVAGGDLFLNAPGVRRSGHLAYSIMRSRLSQPGGAAIPAPYDVTHSLVAVGAQRLGDSWDLGLTLRLSTGRPYTPLLEAPTPGGPTLALGAPYSDRYPDYRRVDARLSRYFRRGSRLVVAFAEMLNLAGRANVVGYGVQSAAGRGEPITTFYGRRTVIVGVEFR